MQSKNVHVANMSKINIIQSVWIPILILIAITTVIITWNAGIKKLGVVNGVLFVNLVPIITFTIGYISGNPTENIEIIGASLTIMTLVANNLNLTLRLINDYLQLLKAQYTTQQLTLASLSLLHYSRLSPLLDTR